MSEAQAPAAPAPATSTESAQAPAAPQGQAPAPQGQTPGHFGVSDTTNVAATPKDSPQVSGEAKAPAESKAPSWMENLPSDMQEYISSKHFTEPSQVVDAYRNLEKLKGVPQERLLKLPESSDAPGWQDVYTKLGKPVSPDGYGIQVDGEDASLANWAKNQFFEANLTQEQAHKVLEGFNKFVSDMNVETTENHSKAVEKQQMDLKKEWGQAYTQNVAKAQAAAREFGIPGEAVDALERAIGHDKTMKLMADIGTRIGEAPYVSGNNMAFGDNVLTPSQAQAKIQRLKSDPSFTKKYLGGDLSAKDELQKLHTMAFGE